MKEELISYQTAVLAKEKGFEQIIEENVVCRIQNKVNKDYQKTRPIQLSDLNNEWSIFNEIYITQSLLQRWLREVHGIHIYISPPDGVWKYLTYTNFSKLIQNGGTGFNTYEEALEAGLLEGLKMIE